MPNSYRVSFGDVRIGDRARELIDRALARNWISEGENVALFEKMFAEKFGWKHAIATSSGTDAGSVVWSAIRELEDLHHYAAHPGEECKGHVITPACAFAATANVILAAGMRPVFVDVDLDTLNLNLAGVQRAAEGYPRITLPVAGIQFVATMGRPTPIREVALLAQAHDLYLVADFCEAHAAGFIIDESKQLGAPGPRFFTRFKYADHFADAAIYSFYAAHLIVAGEGGMICTDDDEIAALCRSIKSHGRRNADIYFHFDRVGYNAKMNELTAAIGIEGLERFDASFEKRRALRMNMVGLIEEINLERGPTFLPQEGISEWEEGRKGILSEIVAPHAFPLVLVDPEETIAPLYGHLEENGVQCKTLFGSLPTQHKAFEFLGHQRGAFPVAERIGRTGLHFGMHEYMTESDLQYIAETIKNYFKGES